MSATRKGWVLVTDGGGNGQSRSALAAVRALAAARYSPAVAVSAPHSLAAASRFCQRRVPVPSWREDGFADAVRAELGSRPYVTVLPASDGELLALGAPVGHLVDKVSMGELAAAAGLSVPPSTVYETLDQLIDRAGELVYPVVVKPAVSDASRPAYRADTPGEIRRYELVGPVVVQGFLGAGLRSVSGVMWRDQLVAVVHQRYLRTWPPDCGTSSAATTVGPDHVLEERLTRMLAGYEGVFQAQLSGQYILDINPRIYGSMPLAVAAGVNLVSIYCDLLEGREVPFTRAREGVFYRWLEGDLRHVARGVLRRTMGLGAAIRSLLPRPRAAHSTESISDPGPMLARLRLYARDHRREPSSR